MTIDPLTALLVQEIFTRYDSGESMTEIAKSLNDRGLTIKKGYTKERTVSWISHFEYGNANGPEYQKQIIDIFVNSVYVFGDKLLFIYNFKDGT